MGQGSAIGPPTPEVRSLQATTSGSCPRRGNLQAPCLLSAFSPHGAAVLIGDGPSTLRLFDTTIRKEIAVFWESPPPTGLDWMERHRHKRMASGHGHLDRVPGPIKPTFTLCIRPASMRTGK